jgi:HEAT repeat protein
MLWWSLQMLKSRNALTRREAVEKLGGMADARLAGTLAAMLNDADPGVRVAAVRALAVLKTEVVLRPISQALKDAAPAVREAAATALGLAGDKRALPLLTQMLKDPNAVVRQKALTALQKFGWEPENDQQRASRAVALGQLQKAAAMGPAAIEPLSLVLQHGNHYERQAAVEALARVGDARVVTPLLGALSDKATNVRTAAIEALGRSGDTRAVEQIAPALQDEAHHVRATAVEALGRLGSSPVVELLITALQDKAWDVRAAAAHALGKLRDARAVEPLITSLGDSDHDVRRNVVEALGLLGHPSALEPLVLMLKDEQASVRTLVPIALRNIDPNWEQSEAAWGALPKLKAALNDREYWVRQAAAQALQRLAAQPQLQPSLDGLSEPEDHKRRLTVEVFLEALGDEDRDLRQAAAEALGRLGDHRIAGVLAQSLQDPDRWVCVAAARSLDVLHWQTADPGQRALQARLLAEAPA